MHNSIMKLNTFFDSYEILYAFRHLQMATIATRIYHTICFDVIRVEKYSMSINLVIY